MSLLPKSIHRCRRYPTKFNSGRDIPGDPVNFLINAAATLFGGVYFSIEVLPESLQMVSRVLPITYSLDAMRKALLLGSGVEGVARELGFLVVFALVLLPFGVLTFRHALRQARREGTLGQF